jgi:hypothetical protein
MDEWVNNEGCVRRYQYKKNAYITMDLSPKRPNVNPIVFYYTQIIYTYIYIYIYMGCLITYLSGKSNRHFTRSPKYIILYGRIFKWTQTFICEIGTET